MGDALHLLFPLVIVGLTACCSVEARVEDTFVAQWIAVVGDRLEHLLFIRNSQLHRVRSALLRLTLLGSGLAALPPRVEILDHVRVRVVRDRSTSLLDVVGGGALGVVTRWLHGPFPLFVHRSRCTQSVMRRGPDDLALIELVSLVTGDAVLPLSRWCILSGAADRAASRFTLLLALPLTVIDARRERGWWLAVPRWFVAALIRDRKLLLDGVLG